MIYTVDDVEKEIIRYFDKEIKGDNKDIIRNTVNYVDDILKNENILAACKDIRDSIVNLSIEGEVVYKDKKFLPDWVKYLVYVIIYQYLSSDKKPKYTQSTLLKEMGLYADIFGKKNWNMYSPDMKVRQAKYKTIDLPFNHAEVEANVIYRAMIHHMICYSRVLTNNFVDVIGKMGLISALCANGYDSAQTWLDDRDYKILSIFKHALKNKDKVLKVLEEVRYEIEHEQNSSMCKFKDKEGNEYYKRVFLNKQQTIELYMAVVAGLELWIGNIPAQELNELIELNVPLVFKYFLSLNDETIYEIIDSCKKIENDEQFRIIDRKGLTEEEKKVNKETNKKKKDKKNSTVEDIIQSYIEKSGRDIRDYPDIYKFVACYIIRQYFAAEYWLDRNLVVEKGVEGNDVVTSELNDKLNINKINLFLDKEVVEKHERGLGVLAEAYGKKCFSLENFNIKEIIDKMKSLTADTYVLDDYIETPMNDTDLLYIDVPKYVREQKRYNFATEWYEVLFSFLEVYEGDWILAWKNYIEVLDDKKKGSIYYKLYSGNKIVSLSDIIYGSEENDINKNDEEMLDMDTNDNMLTCYKRLLKISEGRQLYVFRYRDDDRNHPNSIMFITTIDFPVLDNDAIEKKYEITILNDGRFEKLEYEKFYSNMLKWLNRKTKEQTSEEDACEESVDVNTD